MIMSKCMWETPGSKINLPPGSNSIVKKVMGKIPSPNIGNAEFSNRSDHTAWLECSFSP